jgi:hypothetical protein
MYAQSDVENKPLRSVILGGKCKQASAHATTDIFFKDEKSDKIRRLILFRRCKSKVIYNKKPERQLGQNREIANLVHE